MSYDYKGNTYQLIIFDADGTLRRNNRGTDCAPINANDWELLPDVPFFMAKINWYSVKVGVASNQSIVARGGITYDGAYGLLSDMISKSTGIINMPKGAIRLCPHSSGYGCTCRKPKPRMLLEIINLYGVMRSETLFVGNVDSDKLAAMNAGCDYADREEFFE